MPLVINSLGGGHTHAHMHILTSTQKQFYKPEDDTKTQLKEIITHEMLVTIFSSFENFIQHLLEITFFNCLCWTKFFPDENDHNKIKKL